MTFPIAAAVAALAVFLSPGAYAQLYKCQEGGRTAYQERPCTGGSGETRMNGLTGWAVEWVGCYEGPPKGPSPVGWMRDLQVRSVGSDLVVEVEGSKTPQPARRMTKRELQIMEDGMRVVSGGARVLDGLAIPPLPGQERFMRNEAPHGIYRFAYPDGHEELRVALPTVAYAVKKARCKAS
jgi:hypothetical protein